MHTIGLLNMFDVIHLRIQENGCSSLSEL